MDNGANGLNLLRILLGSGNNQTQSSIAKLNSYIRNITPGSSIPPYSGNTQDFTRPSGHIQNLFYQVMNYYIDQFFPQQNSSRCEQNDSNPASDGETDMESLSGQQDFAEDAADRNVCADPGETLPSEDETGSGQPVCEESTDTDVPQAVPETVYPLSEQSNKAMTNIIERKLYIQPDVIDTHSLVIIRLRIPEGIDEKDYNIDINDTHAAIKWRTGHMEQLIPLPGGILKSQAAAVIIDNILEIRIPKTHGGNERELRIITS